MKQRYKPAIEIPSQFIKPIDYSGLTGRLLHLPAPKNKTKVIVALSGQHASHERMWAIAQLLNEYGEVYLPDMPGFGGMTSFYKIGKKPTLDNYADYLYTFLRSHKLTKDIWFFANSFGSQVMTRMLQKYPQTRDWVHTPIAFVGFAAGTNFAVSKRYKAWLYALIYPASTRLGAFLINAIVFNPISLKIMLFFFSRAKAKMQSDDENLKQDMVRMEAYLWTTNDHRTHAATAITMFRDDLRRYSHEKIPHTIHNIMTESDQYFDNKRVKNTFLELYDGYQAYELDLPVHAPSLIADKEQVRAMLSEETLQLLDS